MQGRGGRGGFPNSDPFAGFGGFGSFGGHQSLLSNFFGGRDPFDDPFFTQPFGSRFESSFFGLGGSPFAGGPSGSPFVGGPSGSPFYGAPHAGFIEQQETQMNKRRGPVIEELNSDDETVGDGTAVKTKDNSRKHSRRDKTPYVEISNEEADDRNDKHMQHQNVFGSRNSMSNAQMHSQSQPQFYSFQSSSVSYGGTNGTYYTKSMTKRAGSDGVAFEEFKEADSTTGQANHRISRGLHNKGHTLARKLNSDGRVDTNQALHNLNEDELDHFEQAWERSSGRHLTGSKQRLEHGNFGSGSSGHTGRGGWALPSTQSPELRGTNNTQTGDGYNVHHRQGTDPWISRNN